MYSYKYNGLDGYLILNDDFLVSEVSEKASASLIVDALNDLADEYKSYRDNVEDVLLSYIDDCTNDSHLEIILALAEELGIEYD